MREIDNFANFHIFWGKMKFRMLQEPFRKLAIVFFRTFFNIFKVEESLSSNVDIVVFQHACSVLVFCILEVRKEWGR